MNGKIGKGVAELYTLFEEYEQGQLKKYSWEINSRLWSTASHVSNKRKRVVCHFFIAPKR